jgi:hypothetical protein
VSRCPGLSWSTLDDSCILLVVIKLHSLNIAFERTGSAPSTGLSPFQSPQALSQMPDLSTSQPPQVFCGRYSDSAVELWLSTGPTTRSRLPRCQYTATVAPVYRHIGLDKHRLRRLHTVLSLLSLAVRTRLRQPRRNCLEPEQEQNT